jgi:hypothetical protein
MSFGISEFFNKKEIGNKSQDVKSFDVDERVKPEKSDTAQNNDTKPSFDPDKRISEVPNERLTETVDDHFDPDKRIENKEIYGDKFYVSKKERIDFADKRSRGEWMGEHGNSVFRPSDPDARRALEKYGQTGIEYRDGNPDFSKVSEATVKITGMNENRLTNNFPKADNECAKLWNKEGKFGKNDWTAREVKEWRKEKRYSWHERTDRTTMDLVQRDIHDECKHYGGVAECKRFEKSYGLYQGGKFDE